MTPAAPSSHLSGHAGPEPATTPVAAPADPVVWVLRGKRAGDNEQVQALAEALGWPVREIECAFRFGGKLPWHPAYGRLGHPERVLTADSRKRIAQQLAKEPPAIVLSVGWRTAPVVRWISAQCPCIKVHLGRPRAPLDLFDIVFSPAQYNMPDIPPVRAIPTPPVRHTVDADTADDTGAWAADFTDQHGAERKLIAVIAGGSSREFRLGPTEAAVLAEQSVTLADAQDADLLVLTSPRTAPEATDALMQGTADHARRQIPWQADSPNPYRYWLRHADGFVVTTDSVSMMAEVIETGKPVWMFETPYRAKGLKVLTQGADRLLRSPRGPRWLRRLYQHAIASGLIYPPRTVPKVAQHFITSGQAHSLANALKPDVKPDMNPDLKTDLNRAPNTARASGTTSPARASVLDMCVRDIQDLWQHRR